MEKYRKLNVLIQFIAVVFLFGCNIKSLPKSYKGKKLIKNRFTYWNQYDLYVDTAFLDVKKLCSGLNNLDSNYIVQSFYTKVFPVDKRPIIYRNIECILDLSMNNRNALSEKIDVKCLVGQKGQVKAFKIDSKHDDLPVVEFAFCISDYKFVEALDSICFTKNRITLNLDMPKPLGGWK